ncbi:hypothetical protein LRP88_07376 [Fusarium phalaenopsidis]
MGNSSRSSAMRASRRTAVKAEPPWIKEEKESEESMTDVPKYEAVSVGDSESDLSEPNDDWLELDDEDAKEIKFKSDDEDSEGDSDDEDAKEIKFKSDDEDSEGDSDDEDAKEIKFKSDDEDSEEINFKADDEGDKEIEFKSDNEGAEEIKFKTDDEDSDEESKGDSDDESMDGGEIEPSDWADDSQVDDDDYNNGSDDDDDSDDGSSGGTRRPKRSRHRWSNNASQPDSEDCWPGNQCPCGASHLPANCPERLLETCETEAIPTINNPSPVASMPLDQTRNGPSRQQPRPQETLHARSESNLLELKHP